MNMSSTFNICLYVSTEVLCGSYCLHVMIMISFCNVDSLFELKRHSIIIIQARSKQCMIGPANYILAPTEQAPKMSCRRLRNYQLET